MHGSTDFSTGTAAQVCTWNTVHATLSKMGFSYKEVVRHNCCGQCTERSSAIFEASPLTLPETAFQHSEHPNLESLQIKHAYFNSV